jgi:hypothetical protein
VSGHPTSAEQTDSSRDRHCRDYGEDTPRAHHEENGHQVAGRFGENHRNAANPSREAVAQYKPKYDFPIPASGAFWRTLAVA